MEAAKQRDTAPELALRAALDHWGLEYEVDAPPIEGMRRSSFSVEPSMDDIIAASPYRRRVRCYGWVCVPWERGRPDTTGEFASDSVFA